jgi:hypothetical protein
MLSPLFLLGFTPTDNQFLKQVALKHSPNSIIASEASAITLPALETVWPKLSTLAPLARRQFNTEQEIKQVLYSAPENVTGFLTRCVVGMCVTNSLVYRSSDQTETPELIMLLTAARVAKITSVGIVDAESRGKLDPTILSLTDIVTSVPDFLPDIFNG